MREAFREIAADFPEALLTAAALALVQALIIGALIIWATPVPA